MSIERHTRLTAKKLELLLKRNLTGEEIAAKLGFESFDEMDKAMESKFNSHTYEKYHTRLTKKPTRKQKAARKEAVSAETEEIESTEKPDEETLKLTLAELRHLESIHQQAVIESENILKTIRQEARENLVAINDLKKQIDAWKTQIRGALAEINTLEDCAFDILDRHDESLKTLHERQKELEAIRQQIEERSVIFILVDSKSGIEAEMDDEPYELEFGDWQPIFNELIGLAIEVLGEFSFNQMVQVAKILSLPSDKEYDITFESEELEEFYKSRLG